jgi:hypothetical protein
MDLSAARVSPSCVHVHVNATAIRLLARELHAGPVKSSAGPAESCDVDAR